MTAYGRASDIFSFGKLIVEINAVNRKTLDILVYLPKDLMRFDIDVRKWITSEVERGQLTVRVSLLNDEINEEMIHSHLKQLKNLQGKWNRIAHELGFDPKQNIDLSFLLSQLQEDVSIDSKEQELEFKEALQRVVHAALDELMQMKMTEGKALSFDMRKRLELIQEHLNTIEGKKQDFYERYRQKILKRLGEITEIAPELEEKIARELALLAERLDVTEELVRFRVHIEQMRQQLLSSDKAIGRTLEFLVQEMFREINTLGSKSMDADISHFVVIIKSELEKIREQLQNIE